MCHDVVDYSRLTLVARLSHGFVSRLPRLVPDDGIEMEGHYLPKHVNPPVA